ncbi:cysteine desulfurase [Puteibacter caeruleilacunae]|nr:cysteine desulfurase [Puteibacter caeruleilacunae]
MMNIMRQIYLNPFRFFKRRSKYKTYFDYAASTPVLPAILKEMEPYFLNNYHNPSNSNSLQSLEIEQLIEEYSMDILNLFGSEKYKIVYTSGATESINMCLKGLFNIGYPTKRKIITTKTEHNAVISVCDDLAKLGAEIVYLPVDNAGLISLRDLEAQMDENTLAVVLMGVNNETGVINDIEGIAKLCAAKSINFCCDTTQTIGKIPIDLSETPIDFLVGSAHKIYGPKGVGFLVMSEKHGLPALIHGGGQQNNLRSGTVNVPSIVGFYHALKYSCNNLIKFNKHVCGLRDFFEEEILKFGCFQVVCKNSYRSPYISNIQSTKHDVNVLFAEIQDQITYSTSSACSSAKNKGSHVLQAMGYLGEQSANSVRFSFSHLTTKKDIKSLLKLIHKQINRIENE